MLREKIDELIAQATRNSDPNIETLRLIKAEFQKYNASKEAVNKPMDDIIEIQILNKMVKQRKESEELYLKGNRNDLANQEQLERVYIESFLPAPITEKEINAEVNQIFFDGVMPIKKNMGLIIKKVKEKYPTADGKLVSKIVSEKFS